MVKKGAWKNSEKNVQLDWILGRGVTNPEIGAGATVDHTLGTENGGYVFMKTTFTKGYKGFFIWF